MKKEAKPKKSLTEKLELTHADGSKVCPNCGNTRFKTIVKNSSWECYHCKQVVVRELSETKFKRRRKGGS